MALYPMPGHPGESHRPGQEGGLSPWPEGIFPGTPAYDANGNPTGWNPGGGGAAAPFGGGGGSANSAYGPYAGGYQFPAAGAGGAGPTAAGAGGGFWSQAGNWAGNNWQDIAGALLLGYTGYQDARNAGRPINSSGSFNSTSTNTPWMPQYNQAGLEAALALLQGQRGGGGGGGGRAFDYFSDDILEGLMGRVQGGDPLYGLADSYVGQTLGGGDANPYRAGLMQDLEGFSDPYVDSFLRQIMGGGGGGGLFGGPGYGGGGGFGGGGGGMPASAGTALGIADYIRPILEGQFLGEGNPHLEDLISRTQDRARQAYMETELPEINSMYEGAGRYGGSEFGIARALGADRLGQTMGDIATNLGFSGYESERDRMMEALGLGTQWDMHLGDLGAEWGRIGASNAATAAGAHSASQDRALQEWLGRLGATTDVLGMRSGLTQFGMGGRLGLADLMSQDQNFALSMIPELSGLDVRDWTAALDRSLSLDQLRLGQRAQDRSFGQNAAQAPWRNLQNYTDIVRGLTGGYGTSTEQGFDQRQQSGGGGGSSNAWMQAALAALAGSQMFGNRGGN